MQLKKSLENDNLRARVCDKILCYSTESYSKYSDAPASLKKLYRCHFASTSISKDLNSFLDILNVYFLSVSHLLPAQNQKYKDELATACEELKQKYVSKSSSLEFMVWDNVSFALNSC